MSSHSWLQRASLDKLCVVLDRILRSLGDETAVQVRIQVTRKGQEVKGANGQACLVRIKLAVRADNALTDTARARRRLQAASRRALQARALALRRGAAEALRPWLQSLAARLRLEHKRQVEMLLRLKTQEDVRRNRSAVAVIAAALQRKMAAELRVLKCLVRWGNRLSFAALARWCDLVSDKRWMRETARQVLGRWSHLRLAMALEAWDAAAAAAITHRFHVAAVQLAARVRAALARWAWKQLNLRAARALEDRQRKEAAARAICGVCAAAAVRLRYRRNLADAHALISLVAARGTAARYSRSRAAAATLVRLAVAWRARWRHCRRQVLLRGRALCGSAAAMPLTPADPSARLVAMNVALEIRDFRRHFLSQAAEEGEGRGTGAAGAGAGAGAAAHKAVIQPPAAPYTGVGGGRDAETETREAACAICRLPFRACRISASGHQHWQLTCPRCRAVAPAPDPQLPAAASWRWQEPQSQPGVRDIADGHCLNPGRSRALGGSPGGHGVLGQAGAADSRYVDDTRLQPPATLPLPTMDPSQDGKERPPARRGTPAAAFGAPQFWLDLSSRRAGEAGGGQGGGPGAGTAAAEDAVSAAWGAADKAGGSLVGGEGNQEEQQVGELPIRLSVDPSETEEVWWQDYLGLVKVWHHSQPRHDSRGRPVPEPPLPSPF